MDSDDSQQSAVGESAGQQLKRAREKHNLSLSDIADAQHLRVSIIQAIEDGHYDQIDSELFLKGYVRAYAKQVGADADALILSLDRELEPLRKEREKQELEDPLADLERRRRKKRRLAKVLGIIVLLSAVALAAWKLVLEPRMLDSLPNTSEQSESTGSPGADEAESGPGENENPEPDRQSEAEQGIAPVESSEPADSPEPSNNLAMVNETEVESTADSLGSTEPENSPETVNDLAPGTISPDETPDNEIAASEPVSIEPVATPDPVFEESAQPGAVTAPVRLEMSFVSDCWVQVTDAAGDRLVASLQREGDQINVSGRAPLNVVIGAVDAVDTVRFDGEPVNLSDFRVFNNRTEFTLTL
jgi:cytoskeleton protein RodZ